jgi:peptidyl-prolyl cis-trans isomerase SurA
MEGVYGMGDAGERSMRRRTAGALLALALGAAPAGAEEGVVDGIAAQVGGEIVLVSEVRNLVGPMEVKLREAGAPEDELAALRSDALERLIERALVRQVVKRAELEATDVEVDTAIASIASENGITQEQLVATVEGEGLPYAVYRERIRGEIEQSKVLNGMVASKVHVDESEVRAAFHEAYQNQPRGGDEVRLRHLLVPYTREGGEARRAACATAERARGRLVAGESFDLVASQVTERAPGSGDLGWIHEGGVASWMSGKIAGAGPGAVTEVIETDFGCNVLQIVDRRPFQPKSYEEVREQIHQRLFAERMQREYLKFMDKLREQTYIERKGVFAQAPPVGGSGPFGSGAAGEDPSGF